MKKMIHSQAAMLLEDDALLVSLLEEVREVVPNTTMKKLVKDLSTIKKATHECSENAVPYEFFEDGRRYHGFECKVCGKHLQAG